MKTFLLVAVATLMLLPAKAQEVVKLWDGLAPGAIESSEYAETIVFADKQKTKPRIAKVTDPTITIYLPSGDVKSLRAGVIVCPGGGYGRLSYDVEGVLVAKALVERGFAAFVLKYRLPSDVIMKDRQYGPLSDALRALTIVRSRAAEFGILPDRIGIMGFSAGGNLASTASTLFGLPEMAALGNDSTLSRPDFTVLGYPVVSLRNSITHKGTRFMLVGKKDNEEELAARFSADENVTRNTPPAFLFHCADDPAVPPTNSINYFSALRANGIKAELHIFQEGGHGFGLATGTRNAVWIDLFRDWAVGLFGDESAK